MVIAFSFSIVVGLTSLSLESRKRNEEEAWKRPIVVSGKISQSMSRREKRLLMISHKIF